MARFLKQGRDADLIAAEDVRVRATVEGILADIAARGDKAVRELSVKFDSWDRADFRLTDREIRDALAQLAAAGHRRHQIRAGAGPQFRRAPARGPAGHRGGDAARRGARPQEHPGELGRLLCPGREVSDGGLRAHVGRHRQGRRRAAHRRPARRRSRASRRRRSSPPASGRRGRDLLPRRHPGGRRDGARHRDASGRSTCWSGPATPIVAEAKRQLFGRVGIDLLRRPDRDAGHRRRERRRRDSARPTCSARPSTARPRRRSC